MAPETATPEATLGRAYESARAASVEASRYTPAFNIDDAVMAAEMLQQRLRSLIDLHLTLKHIHWNVTGPEFAAIHQMLDPQADQVRDMSDRVAERVATLGGVPVGTPGAVAANRSWGDYDLGRASSREHLERLDQVYTGVIADHRHAVEKLGELDLVSQDLLVGQTDRLELFQWFVRAHLDG